jgi:hypothetical protein
MMMRTHRETAIARAVSKWMDAPRGDASDKSTRVLALRHTYVFNPEPDVALEFLERALEDVELAADERVVGDGGRALDLCKVAQISESIASDTEEREEVATHEAAVRVSSSAPRAASRMPRSAGSPPSLPPVAQVPSRTGSAVAGPASSLPRSYMPFASLVLARAKEGHGPA